MALGFYPAIMVLCHFFDNRQPHSRATVLSIAMQPLEHLENSFRFGSVKANAVITHFNEMVRYRSLLFTPARSISVHQTGTNGNMGGHTGPVIFQCISYQVLK